MSISRFDRRLIKETLADLRRLQRTHAESLAGERIAAFVLLKAEPGLTIDEAAVRLGKSRRTLYRWIEDYRRGGVTEVLNPSIRPGRPKRLGMEELEELKSQLSSGSVREMADIRKYLSEKFGVDFSRTGVWYVLKRDLRDVSRGWVTVHDDRDRIATQEREFLNSAGMPTRIAQFLNSLPITGDVADWIAAFKEALAMFLADVDRITINIDLNFDLIDPENYDVRQIISQHVPGSEESARKRVAITAARYRTGAPSESLVVNAARSGFPVDSFHGPTCFDYMVGSGYIGSLILWRNRTESPISEQSIEMMNMLEPFIQFVLSDIIVRNKAARPVDAAFSDALKRMNEDANLTVQEERVVVLQLMGHSYKEMADVLSISVDGIKKHFSQIHRKTKTKSLSALFARYFSFRIIGHERAEEEGV